MTPQTSLDLAWLLADLLQHAEETRGTVGCSEVQTTYDPGATRVFYAETVEGRRFRVAITSTAPQRDV